MSQRMKAQTSAKAKKNQISQVTCRITYTNAASTESKSAAWSMLGKQLIYIIIFSQRPLAKTQSTTIAKHRVGIRKVVNTTMWKIPKTSHIHVDLSKTFHDDVHSMVLSLFTRNSNTITLFLCITSWLHYKWSSCACIATTTPNKPFTNPYQTNYFSRFPEQT